MLCIVLTIYYAYTYAFSRFSAFSASRFMNNRLRHGYQSLSFDLCMFFFWRSHSIYWVDWMIFIECFQHLLISANIFPSSQLESFALGGRIFHSFFCASTIWNALGTSSAHFAWSVKGYLQGIRIIACIGHSSMKAKKRKIGNVEWVDESTANSRDWVVIADFRTRSRASIGFVYFEFRHSQGCFSPYFGMRPLSLSHLHIRAGAHMHSNFSARYDRRGIYCRDELIANRLDPHGSWMEWLNRQTNSCVTQIHLSPTEPANTACSRPLFMTTAKWITAWKYPLPLYAHDLLAVAVRSRVCELWMWSLRVL